MDLSNFLVIFFLDFFIDERSNTDSDSQSDSNTQMSETKPKCNQCKLETDSKSITCFKCEEIVHYECSALSKRDFDYLFPKKKQHTVLKFVCPSCIKDIELCKSKDSKEKPQNIEERVDDLGQIVKMAIEQNKMVIEQNKMVMEQNNKILEKMNPKQQQIDPPPWPKLKMEENIQNSFKEILTEDREKEEKKQNLVMFGVPEEKAPGDTKESKKKDHEKVTDIVCFVNKDCEPDELKHCTVTRLGKKKEDATRPRPIKVTFDSFELKRKTLKNARQLKEYKIKSIGISPDKTKKELEEDRTLRTELRRAKDTDQNTQYMIFEKKVMKRDEVTKIREERDKHFRDRVTHSSGDPPGGETGVKQA